MCYKHIPKEYLRRKIIRIFRPNVFGSYLIVFFRLRLASPRSRIESGTSTLDVPENLYRITTVFRIRYCRIHLCLLCFSESSGKSELKNVFRRSPNSLVVTVNSLSVVGVYG